MLFEEGICLASADKTALCLTGGIEKVLDSNMSVCFTACLRE